MVGDRAGCGFGGRFRCLRRDAFCHPNRHQNACLHRSALAPAGGAIPRVVPQRQILVVIDAPTPELVEQAAAKLAQALATRSDLIHSVRQIQGGNFFARNGLLYLPTDEVARVTDGLTRADVLLETLAADPSLRGTLDALSLGITGVQRGALKLDDMTRPMTMAADTAENVFPAGPQASRGARWLAANRRTDGPAPLHRG